MQFETGHLYHIYNQGNNRQLIFFERENYFYFLRKIRNYTLPYADILAWCLMPNHFHLMVYCRVAELAIIHGVTSSHPVNSRVRSFNDSIGIMLRSYTRGVNKQQHRTGALFREQTKAICLTNCYSISLAWFNQMGITRIDNSRPEMEYSNVCFNYILNNPVRHGIVEQPEDWEFSSYIEMREVQNTNLINKDRIKEYGLEFIR